MPCEWIKLPGGGVAHIRTSGRQPMFCQFCRERPATKLCDMAVKVNGKKGTCDASICDECSTRVGKNRDYCPNHKQYAEQESLFV